MLRFAPVLAVLALLLGAPAAPAYLRLPAVPASVRGNPADALAGRPIEVPWYDPATRCTPKAARPGLDAFVAWLQQHAAGTYWGSYRCERWGRRSASLHAEKRAVDWHLDARTRAGRAGAARLILLLLAPDRLGTPQALARRMGVEEIIWDCGYWGAGMAAFKPYRVCYDGRGRFRRHVDATAGHRDHVHLGLTRAGAMGWTSFWMRGRAARR